jgi:hypothetical protein
LTFAYSKAVLNYLSVGDTVKVLLQLSERGVKDPASSSQTSVSKDNAEKSWTRAAVMWSISISIAAVGVLVGYGLFPWKHQ